MPTFLPDSSCIVARLDDAHPQHLAARGELDRRLERGEGMVAAAPSVVEAYSVLTRMPHTRRLGAPTIFRILRESFVEGTPVVALDPSVYLSLLETCVRRGIAGGGAYDAVIAACARQGGADALLTFNARHFSPFAGPDLEIVVPAAR
jgi:predicted nucleic acid-binding protein